MAEVGHWLVTGDKPETTKGGCCYRLTFREHVFAVNIEDAIAAVKILNGSGCKIWSANHRGGGTVVSDKAVAVIVETDVPTTEADDVETEPKSSSRGFFRRK